MKLLYMPCHAVLEFDQMRLWHELGHEVFSLGSYIDPAAPHDPKRPALPHIPAHPELAKGVTGDAKELLPLHLVEWADAIVIDHIPRWVANNWPRIRHKNVVWRTIGQSTPDVENALRPYAKDLFIVRYSDREQQIPGYVGGDALIPFYKDPDEYGGWNGSDPSVITLAQHMRKRKEFCHFDVFEHATRGYPRKLYGPGNEDTSMTQGEVDYEQMKAALRDHRVFFFTGTQPASYTLSLIEAMMTGIPIVAAGPRWMDDLFHLNLYEIPDIIVNGMNGYWSDDISSLRDGIGILLKDYDLACAVSEAGRETAIRWWSKEMVKEEWREFFDQLSQ